MGFAVRMGQQGADHGSSAMFADNDAVRRRLLYRSKMRGWLEMDIMLGKWAAANLQELDDQGLDQFAEVLAMENPDLYKWLTGQAPVPDEIKNDVLRRMLADLEAERVPKVTVASTVEFKGAVWE